MTAINHSVNNGENTASKGTSARRDMNGRLPSDPDYQPFNTVAINAKHAAKRDADAAFERRVKRWAGKRYPVAILDAVRDPWARNIQAAILDTNARRDPMKAEPLVMFKGDEAVKAGATDDDLCVLDALAPDEIAELRQEAAAIRAATQQQIRDRGRRIAAGRETTVSAPEPVDLGVLLAEPDEGAAHRIAEVWPAGGRVLLAAQYKGGKSTMVGNAVKPLVDGGKFLGRFDVTPVSKVALIDTELDRRTLRRWLGDQNIRNTAAVLVVPLRGAVSAFDILDPATRTEWAQRLAGADVVILDCLRPVLDALGLSEDKDAGKMLVAFDALLAEIGASEGLVVTHMGHQNGPASERARGDSRLLDWPDALWKIVRDGEDADDDGTRRRYFSALGRDVTLPEGLLTFDAATRHLSYGSGNRRDSAAINAMPELLKIVRSQPGKLSKRGAEELLCNDSGLTQKDARRTIAKAINEKLILVEEGPRRSQLLLPGGVDPFAAAPDLSTGPEGR